MPQIIRTGYADKRPNPPSSWLKTKTSERTWWKKDPEFEGGKYEMTMTYHHNIPDTMWREFWNLMLFNNWADEMYEFLYLSGMDDKGGSKIRISTIIDKLKGLHKEFVRIAGGTGEAASDGYTKEYTQALIAQDDPWFVGDQRLLTSDEMDEVALRVSWQAWNVVEGPLNTIRLDDPGEKFDDFSGLIPKTRSGLIKDFHSYVSMQIKSKNTQIKRLRNTLEGFRFLRNMKVIPFTLNIWEKNVKANGRIPMVSVNSISRESWRKRSVADSPP